MSSKNYALTNTMKNVLQGVSYDGKNQLMISPSLHETYSTIFANPVSSAPGGVCRVDVNLSVDDEHNYNEIYLEFDWNNLDSVLTQTIFNPFLCLSEVKLLINNQQVQYLDSLEKIFVASSWYFRQFNNAELKTNILKILPTQTTATSGETIGTLSTTTFSLPLTVLFPWIKNISRSDGVYKLSVEFKFNPNTATASSIGRFVKSSTTNNPWTSSVISFTNIKLRQVITKHSDPYLRNLPSSMMLLNCAEDKMYNVSWNANSATVRCQLSTEFSHHSMCHSILIYLYDISDVNSYNDSNAGKQYSELNNIGFELKYKTRTICKYDTVSGAGTGLSARRQYAHHVHRRRYGGKEPNIAMFDGSDATCQYYYPITMIDLQAVDNDDHQNNNIISGISNKNSELELILTNCVSGGTFSTSLYLYVVLCYNEIALLDRKSGNISFKR